MDVRSPDCRYHQIMTLVSVLHYPTFNKGLSTTDSFPPPQSLNVLVQSLFRFVFGIERLARVTPPCATDGTRASLVGPYPNMERLRVYGVQYKFEVDDVVLIVGKDWEVAKPTKSYRGI